MTISNSVVDVDGIQVLAQREYTSSTVKDVYEANMQVLRDFLSSTTPPGSSPLTDQQLQTAIKNLRDLAINGLSGPIDQSNPSGEQKIYYLTEGMNQALDLLFRTLNVAGVTIPKTGEIDTSGAATTSTWYQQWYNLGAATPLIQNALAVALTASQTNYSLQSMVELLYVKRANDQLGEKMGDLQEALQVTKDTLSLLTNLQDLHNQIQVNNKPPFSTFFNIFTANPGTFSSQYQTAASAYFGTPIIPDLLGDGYKVTNANYGFLNYLFNVAAPGVTFEKGTTAGTYLINFTPETKALIPAGFLAAYGLEEVSPGSDTYTTTDTTKAVEFIKDVQFFSGIYIGPPNYTINVPLVDIANPSRPEVRDLLRAFGLFPDPAKTNNIFVTGDLQVKEAMQAFGCQVSGDNITVPLSLIMDTGANGTLARLLLSRPTVSTQGAAILYTTAQFDVVGGAAGLYQVTTIVGPPSEPVLGPGKPKFSDFYTINYDVATDSSGLLFTGTTQTAVGGLYNGEGTSNLAYILSGIFGLNRDGLLSKVQELVKYRNDLSAQIAHLNLVNPSGIGDANSLQGRLAVALKNIKDVFKTAGGDPITSGTSLVSAYAGYKAWVIDNYGSTGIGANTAGEIQQNITNAITAGQSLNDTQKESVRQFLFIFEEFYKSASAILQSLTQIIERIAQGLSRG